MKYIFEVPDIISGQLVGIINSDIRMIIQQHESNAENIWTRKFALLKLSSGQITSGWMDAENLAKYLTDNLYRPVNAEDVFISDT